LLLFFVVSKRCGEKKVEPEKLELASTGLQVVSYYIIA
jgi:hypothetical protein